MFAKAAVIASVATLALAADKKISVFTTSNADCAQPVALLASGNAKDCNKPAATGVDSFMSFKFGKFTKETVEIVPYTNADCSTKDNGMGTAVMINRAAADKVTAGNADLVALKCMKIGTMKTMSGTPPVETDTDVYAISTGSAYSMVAGAIVLAAAATQF